MNPRGYGRRSVKELPRRSFWPRDAHGDWYGINVREFLPLVDIFGFWSLFTGGLFLLVLFEVPVSNQYFDCILEMDAIFSIVPVAFVEPAVFAFVSSWFRECLSRKAYPSLFEFRIFAFR